MVDAQAEVLRETEHAVVPPGKYLLGLVEQAEAVDEAEAEQALEGGALWLRAEDLAGPGLGVVHVAVVGGDVVVAAQRQPRVRGQFLAEPDRERVEPAQLVVVLVAADRLAVRHVGADDAGVADRAADQAFLLIGKMRIADQHLADRLAREQGDAVVGLLPGERGVVAGGLDLGQRERGVLELQFLQADDVRPGFGQPVEQVRQPDFQRIDVPARYLHLASPPDGLLP